MSSGLPEDDAWADRHMDWSSAQVDDAGRRRAALRRPDRRPRSSTPTSATCCSVTARSRRRPAPSARSGSTSTTWSCPEHDDWARPPAGTAMVGDGAFAGMGGLWSCVEDVARWIAWLDDAFPPVTSPRARRRPVVARRAPRDATDPPHERPRRRLRVRPDPDARRPLRNDRQPLRRPAGVRVEHALAARPARRRRHARERDLRTDGRAVPTDARRPRRPRPRAARRDGLTPSASRRCRRATRRGRSTPGTTPWPTASSPTTWPSTSRTRPAPQRPPSSWRATGRCTRTDRRGVSDGGAAVVAGHRDGAGRHHAHPVPPGGIERYTIRQ